MKETDKQFYKAVGARLRQARKEKGLTQQQVADLLGLGRTRVTQHEIGQCAMPHTTAVKYAELYEVTLDYLIGVETEVKKNPFEEFMNIEFCANEILEITNYVKYILSKRSEH